MLGLALALLAGIESDGSPGADQVQLNQLRDVVHVRCPIEEGEIIVCGRRDPNRHRLPVLPVGPVEDGLPSSLGLNLSSTARVGVQAHQNALPNGMISTAVVATLKLRF